MAALQDKQRWLDLLSDIIKSDKTHQDYKRVCDLSILYRALVSGEGLEKELKQFSRREDAAMFAQRVAITQHITPAIAENLINPLFKVARSNRAYQSITTKDKGQLEDIKKALKGFYGEGELSGLDYYMQTRFVDLTNDDPNAFIAVEFDTFDPKIEKAKPKPIEISCEEAVMFQYKNAILQYLLAKFAYQYKTKDNKLKDGARYVLYIPDFAFELREMDKDLRLTDLADGSFEVFEVGRKGETNYKVFTLQIFEPKSGVVPAVRVGYKRDSATRGRTYVSPVLHPALPYLRKSIKAVSELDLTVALHVHPQKLQYVTPCPGESGKGCMNGKTREGGSLCKRCNGSGADPISTTAQDVLRVPLPKDTENLVDLEKLVAYKTPSVELIKWMDEYVDKISEKAIRAVYNSNQFTKPTTAKTATEIDDTADSINDTLSPFAKKYSSAWMQFVRLIATYTETDNGLDVYHKFPSDFKFRTQGTLLKELELANKSGAPAYVLDSLNADLIEILYADDRDTLEKIKIKQKYMPFKGKTPEQISVILASALTSNYHKVLFVNFEEIWDALEEEMGSAIWLMASSKQREAIRKKVDEISLDVQKAQAKAFAQFGQQQQPANPANPGGANG
jgi:hypothetical protein